MLERWGVEGDFSTIYHSGGDLNRSVSFISVATPAVIKKLNLCGYSDGAVRLTLKAVNGLTWSFIKDMGVKRSDLEVMIEIGHLDELLKRLSRLCEARIIDEELALVVREQYKGCQLPKKTAYCDHRLQALTEDEVSLYTAINYKDVDGVKALLVRDVNPNPPPVFYKTPLLTAVWHYIETKDEDFLKIVQLLLDYHANVWARHGIFGATALSSAVDSQCVALITLLTQYQKEPEFRVESSNVDNRYLQSAQALKRPFQRMSLFSKKVSLTPTNVRLLESEHASAALYITEFSNQDSKITVETYRITSLSPEDGAAVFALFQQNFGTKDNTVKQFSAMMDISRDRLIYCDVIKAGGKTVGFNAYEILEGQYQEKSYQVLYCIYAYIDKAYRGTRAMSLISFRPAHILKLTKPDVETYIFYDAIHLSSFRQAHEMKPYPLYRTENSTSFVKHIAARIYGEAVSEQFDGKTNFCWPTKEQVIGNAISPETYDYPYIIRQFEDITGTPQRGGVPIMWPVTQDTFKKMCGLIDSGLNNPGAFMSHVREIVSRLYNVFDEVEMPDADSCLFKR